MREFSLLFTFFLPGLGVAHDPQALGPTTSGICLVAGSEFPYDGSNGTTCSQFLS